MVAKVGLSRKAEPLDPLAMLQSATKQYVDTAAGKYLPVANGTHFNGNWGNPSTSLITGTRTRSSRKLLRVIAAADELQVEWANIYTTTVAPGAGQSCEIPGPNAVTLRMSIEYPAGKPRQTAGSTAWSSATAYVQFDQVTHAGSSWVATAASTNQTPAAGSAFWRLVRRYAVNWDTQTDTAGTVVFAPGDYRKSQPVRLQEMLQPGDCIAVLGAFDCGAASGAYIPYAGANGAANHGTFVDWVVDSAAALPAVGSALPDTGVTNQTNGNTTAANASDNLTWMKIPYATAITGNIGTSRCVAIFGDSIAQGYGGDIRDGEPCGIFPRAVDGSSWWRVAQGGNRATNYHPGNAPWQMSVLQRCSSVVCSMALNDINQGQTSAQVQESLTRLWRVLAATGRPLYVGMLTPISASSDAWATTANQTRYTAGGTIPTTQYPADDATYLTSVYGIIAQWISNQGIPLTAPDGGTVYAGQANHPVTGILDWRSLMSDPATSWKWLPGFTTDGAHPNPVCVGYEVDYLRAQVEPLLQGRVQALIPPPAWNPSGEVAASVQSMTRSEVNVLSTALANSTMSVVGVSVGRRYTQTRVWAGTSGTLYWTVLAGMDPAKMRIIDSGTASAVANSLFTITYATPQYIPAGYMVAVVLTAPTAANRQWGGRTALAAGLHTTGSGMTLAGTSADVNAPLTGVINMFTKWTVGTFRAWAELV